MRFFFIIIAVITVTATNAQEVISPKVTKASYSDTSGAITNLEQDTFPNRWENGIVRNHFRDSIFNDTIHEAKGNKLINRKKRKTNHKKNN